VIEQSKRIATLSGAEYEAAQEQLKRDDAAAAARLDGWTVEALLGRCDRYRAVRCVYDPDAKRIKLNCRSLALDPAEYEHHLEITSEVLEFLSAIPQAPVLDLKLHWYSGNQKLHKIIWDLLDHKAADWDKLRVAVDDDEEWDYQNLAFDHECRRLEFSRPSDVDR
jgi:hypothetical protein